MPGYRSSRSSSTSATVAPDARLTDAAKVLETYRISSLPVVDGTKLVGVLTVTDLLRAFVQQNEELAA